MGTSNGEADEQPVHTVRLSPYTIQTKEVTAAEYNLCVKAGKCTPAHYTDGECMIWTEKGFQKVKVPEKYQNPDYPVVCVSWYQAQQYCRSKGMKLPTEAQWENAARGGKNMLYAWGNEMPSAKHCTSPGRKCPDSVGSYSPNLHGLYDMTGNVWEWTSDRYEKEYYKHSPVENPPGPDAGFYRVIRGGGWYSGPKQLRVTNRHWFTPGFGEVSVGFRCVR